MKRYPPRLSVPKVHELDYAGGDNYSSPDPPEPPRKQLSLPVSIALGLGGAMVMICALLGVLYILFGWWIFVD